MQSEDVFSSILILRSVCGDGAVQDLSLPLWCDLTVLPEIHGSNNAVIRVRDQSLHPCGMDNILFLQGLIAGQGYLLSISNCFTRINDGGSFPVLAYPSTFVFTLKAIPPFKNDFGVLIKAKEPTTELHVTFDTTQVKEAIYPTREGFEDLRPPSPSIIGSNDTLATCRAEMNAHANALRLLESLAEREARDVELILTGLSVLLAFLLCVYGRTIYIVAKKSQLSKAETTQTIADKPYHTSSGSSLKSFLPSADIEIEHAGINQPPVEAVIIDRASNEDVPALIDEQPELCATPKFCFLGLRGNAVSPSPSRPDIVTKPVSPCSQLEKAWEQKKAARRSRRRVRQTLSPSSVGPIHVPEDMGVLGKLEGRPRLVPLKELPMDRATSDGVAPFCTLVSDESFLNDYW